MRLQWLLSLSFIYISESNSPPRPALLWSCDLVNRGAFQSWTQPNSLNGTIFLKSNSSLVLSVLGWPSFSYNTPLVSAGAVEASLS